MLDAVGKCETSKVIGSLNIHDGLSQSHWYAIPSLYTAASQKVPTSNLYSQLSHYPYNVMCGCLCDTAVQISWIPASLACYDPPTYPACMHTWDGLSRPD